MEGRAGAVVEGDDATTALYRALNFFPTPPWAGRAGGELVRQLDPAARSVLEPACGQGHMAGPLREGFPIVMASDVHDYGYGTVSDFLNPGLDFVFQPDWVITNPPFAKAEAFVRRGLEVARRGVAVLCRLAFVESVGRYPLMREMAVMAPFAERVPMQLGSWDPDLSSATAYAWFVWMKSNVVFESPLGGAIGMAWSAQGALVRNIPPGTCERLTRADDRVVYGGEAVPGLLTLAGGA
ncbi:MAG: hypothetical protein K2X61_08250 [Caulobacteraceae bacterium]|nr:hypothetical protein [Caulobacteraceae bacterium]